MLLYWWSRFFRSFTFFTFWAWEFYSGHLPGPQNLLWLFIQSYGFKPQLLLFDLLEGIYLIHIRSPPKTHQAQ
jgi:hypothetical protein